MLKKRLIATVLAITFVVPPMGESAIFVSRLKKDKPRIRIKTFKEVSEEVGERHRKEYLKIKSRQQTIRGNSYKLPKKKIGTRAKFIITYYTNENSLLEGGQHDKLGRPLVSHNKPVVALPPNIPYGTRILLDKPLNGHPSISSRIFTNVDTGGAITYTNGGIRVDVFVPNVSPRWIESNLKNKTIYGYVLDK